MGRSKELGLAVKPRIKKEKDETNIMEETQEIYIPPEKRKQIIKDLKLFYVQHTIKYQGLLLKNGLKFKANLEVLTIQVNQ